MKRHPISLDDLRDAIKMMDGGENSTLWHRNLNVTARQQAVSKAVADLFTTSPPIVNQAVVSARGYCKTFGGIATILATRFFRWTLEEPSNF